MSVEGSGGTSPSQKPPEQEALDNIKKFETNLFAYNSEQDDAMKTQQKQILQNTMSLIQASLTEVSRSGVQKQGQAVQSDFQDYMDSGSDQDLTKLTQDMATLKQALSESA